MHTYAHTHRDIQAYTGIEIKINKNKVIASMEKISINLGFLPLTSCIAPGDVFIGHV